MGNGDGMIRRPLPAILPLALTLLTLACRPSASAPTETAAPSPAPVAATPVEPAGAVVVVSVDGVEPGGEPVDAALQTQAQWGTDQVTLRARVPADASTVALRFDGVALGSYGVVAVQPVTPPAGPPVADQAPARPASAPPGLSPKSRSGWAASGATGRRLPEWAVAGAAVGPDGRTVPLTLQRP